MPISLYGIAQYFGFDPWLDPAGYHAGEGPFTIVRPPSTLGHSNYFGAYLVYVVFAAVALTRISESRLSKTLAITCGVIASMAILFSGTRAAMVGLGVGTLILADTKTAVENRSLSASGGIRCSRTHYAVRIARGAGSPDQTPLVTRRTARRSQTAAVAGHNRNGKLPISRRLRS